VKHLRVDGYAMAYLEVGEGAPIVCVHGSLCDFRIWSPVLGPLSRRHRVIVPSLRHFFPERWDGVGGEFTMSRHIADMIGLVAQLGAGPVDLLGHSRGGHIAFRVAQQRPDLLRRMILAEPGGDLDASFPQARSFPALHGFVAAAVEKIAARDIEGGLAAFWEVVDGPTGWARLSEAVKQQLRDNVATLLGQTGEGRRPYTVADARSIALPTLLIGGAETQGPLRLVFQALAETIPGVRVATIPNASHMMLDQRPAAFCAAVLDFLD
jgi:pimeloyl-ACP methyl ester carboxylesterase